VARAPSKHPLSGRQAPAQAQSKRSVHHKGAGCHKGGPRRKHKANAQCTTKVQAATKAAQGASTKQTLKSAWNQGATKAMAHKTGHSLRL